MHPRCQAPDDDQPAEVARRGSAEKLFHIYDTAVPRPPQQSSQEAIPFDYRYSPAPDSRLTEKRQRLISTTEVDYSPSSPSQHGNPLRKYQLPSLTIDIKDFTALKDFVIQTYGSLGQEVRMIKEGVVTKEELHATREELRATKEELEEIEQQQASNEVDGVTMG
ncbi:hypothetical protein VM1G_11507 [Cytospora mali]|uniref:Uncharacterized protein n=1 Tax=Cytospora mali TaxID=578113 RepID=A0A194VV29_CYTMA|nr:hypothetical protein VM1G_11507 [Valsa mali]